MKSFVDRNVVMRHIPVLVTGGKNTWTPRHNQLQLCSSLQVYVNYPILLLARHLGGPDSLVSIATGYWLDGPGIEYRWGRGEIFHTHSNRPWGLTSLL
jgi:hypothetical protein